MPKKQEIIINFLLVFKLVSLSIILKDTILLLLNIINILRLCV